MKNKALYVSALAMALALSGGVALAASPKPGVKHTPKRPPAALAATRPAPQKPAVSGTVASVSGAQVSVTAKNGTVYSVDATSAKITSGFGKMAKTLAVGDIKTGDMLTVYGTASGTSVQATSIMDRVKPPMRGAKVGIVAARANHELVGTVQSISGNIITVTGKDNLTYNVDASHARIVKGAGKKVTAFKLYSIVPGDMLQISGKADATTPTNFTASVIRDLPATPPQK